MELNADIAVIVTDAAGRVRGWNRGAQRLYGWVERDAVGRDILELTPSQQSREEAAAIMDALRRGQAWEGEIILRRKDGQPFRAYVRDVPVGDLSGKGLIVGVSVATDRRALLDQNHDAIQAESALWAARIALN